MKRGMALSVLGVQNKHNFNILILTKWGASNRAPPLLESLVLVLLEGHITSGGNFFLAVSFRGFAISSLQNCPNPMRNT
jgi:hypothetical protein